ncbi:JAB domain-containing protein [Sphingopyxis granuli]|uniref:JAB domain-containing protein n=1 Tax=Sphingopyxis granuli TaxID=267128 RepID=UPI00301D8921
MEIAAPGRGAEIAEALLDEFQSLGRLWAQEPEAIARIIGHHPAATAVIFRARDAAIAAVTADIRGIRIDPFSADLRHYLILSMGSLADERFRILFLDAAHRLIADEEMQKGTISQIKLYPRTIFRRALELNAAGLILVHNHPSGDATPSREDIEVTRHLDQIGRSLGVVVVDHIVVTSTQAHHLVNRDASSANSGIPAFTLKSPDRGGTDRDNELALENAKAMMRRRLLRQQLFGAPGLFGDPAWEMLVDLFIHERERKPISVSALCLTPSIPMSSAIRLCQKLSDAGMILRIPDLYDGRRTFVRLSPDTSHLIRSYFLAGSD